MYDASGTAVAEEGNPVALRGAYAAATSTGPLGCYAEGDEIFTVMSGVDLLG